MISPADRRPARPLAFAAISAALILTAVLLFLLISFLGQGMPASASGAVAGVKVAFSPAFRAAESRQHQNSIRRLPCSLRSP